MLLVIYFFILPPSFCFLCFLGRFRPLVLPFCKHFHPVLGYSVGDYSCTLLCRYQDRERAAEKAFIAKREEEALKKKLAEEAKKKGHTVCPVPHVPFALICLTPALCTHADREEALSGSFPFFLCSISGARSQRHLTCVLIGLATGRCRLEGWTVDEWSRA